MTSYTSLDQYVTKTSATLSIRSIMNSEIARDRLVFPAFLTSYSEAFTSNWNTENVYGRQDPIGTFQGTTRVVSLGFDVVAFAFLYFIVSAIVLGYNLAICVRNFIFPKIEIDWGFWKSMIKEALPFGLSGIFITIYYWIDSVMLSMMVGDEVVGWYNAAYRLIVVLLVIPGIINITIFPTMSRFYVSSQNSLRSMSRKYFKFMLTIAIPMGVGTTLLADKVILLIFGVGYIQSIIALQILVWAMVFIFANAAFVRLFESIHPSGQFSIIQNIDKEFSQKIIGILINTLYAAVDSFIFGFILSSLYNFFVERFGK